MKAWTTAQYEHLSLMRRRHFPLAELARRFGCTPEEIVQRVAELDTLIAQQQAAFAAGKNLTSEQAVEGMKKATDPLTAAFFDATLRYNQLGERLRYFGDLLSTALAPEELATLLQAAGQVTPKFGEAVADRTARVLLQDYIVLKRPEEPPCPPPPATAPSG